MNRHACLAETASDLFNEWFLQAHGSKITRPDDGVGDYQIPRIQDRIQPPGNAEYGKGGCSLLNQPADRAPDVFSADTGAYKKKIRP